MRTIGNILGRSRFAVAIGIGTLAILALPTSALAQPANDNFANATTVGSLPFSDVVDTTGATIEPGEPQACTEQSQTVWYSITPGANETLSADNIGSDSEAEIVVYQLNGPAGIGNLRFLDCSQSPNPVAFRAQAGTTYYIQTGILFGAAGNLHLNLQTVPPPPNDNFANATPDAQLPYTNTVDASGATTESGEPIPCETFFGPIGTVWYAFTPPVSETVTAESQVFSFAMVAAYSGTSLSGLTELGSTCFNNPLSLRLTGGTTYYFQAADVNGRTGPLTFSLFVTPPPIANFVFNPQDPSIFDRVNFFNQSFDPGGLLFQPASWDFGDGTRITTDQQTVSHQYAKDGDYTVKMTVTTVDGRTASTTQVVHVSTHDVAIAKFLTPTAASSGQTRSITVGISNTRYPETVQVQLFKSTPNGFGFNPVGTLTQPVPVLSKGRTVAFNIDYTFTSDDAALGKVSFEAVATIVGSRDALPADNTAISTPTKIGH